MNTQTTAMLTVILQQMATQIPIALSCLVGIVLCLIMWNRCKAAAIWGLLGFLLGGLLVIVIPVTQQLVLSLRESHHYSPSQISTYMSALSVLWSLGRAASYLMLGIAVFVGRSPKTNR